MTKIFFLIASLLQLCTMLQGIPCSVYYKNIVKSETSEIMGKIEIPSPTPKFPPYDLKVGFHRNPLLHTTEPIARLSIAQPVQEAITSVQQGNPLMYHIHFPVDKPIPRLTKIWFHNIQICPSPYEKERFPTTAEIREITYSIDGDNSSSSRIQDQSIINLSKTDNNVCGISSYTDGTNLLINNGEETRPGQWPWLVALFVVRKDHEFTCAGSILTTKHIITAAHCLKLSFTSNDTVHPNVLVVALGRFNLRQWRERGTVNREVASYKIHPDYAHVDNGDSDLAILTLRTPVEYSPFIRPICLWSGSTDLQNIINRIGYVVGWGQDELGNRYTSEPRMARVPIVSQETCLRSYRVFIEITSERTFCAGLRDQSGPCNGDSGSGLVLFDSTTGRYKLRGIVSRSTIGEDFLCDLKKFIVYVDVAKYIPWIQEQIST